MRWIAARRVRSETAARLDARPLGAVMMTVAMLSASPIPALSVFDAIQLSKKGYSDQAIIDLFEATDSAFVLEADDLPKLKELGLNERVIRAMLERVATPSESADPASTNVTRNDGAHHSQATLAPETPFSVVPLLEQRGGGHLHASLFLHGLEILVLRDEGGHESVEARGSAVIEGLREAWTADSGRFQARQTAKGTEIIFRAGAAGRNTSRTIPVMTVSAGDAHGYEIRSGRDVTHDLLARYWADLLSDYWSVDHGERPRLLSTVHEGEALEALDRALEQLEEPTRNLESAAERIPSTTRHHLERLARTIPMDYDRARKR